MKDNLETFLPRKKQKKMSQASWIKSLEEVRKKEDHGPLIKGRSLAKYGMRGGWKLRTLAQRMKKKRKKEERKSMQRRTTYPLKVKHSDQKTQQEKPGQG